MAVPPKFVKGRKETGDLELIRDAELPSIQLFFLLIAYRIGCCSSIWAGNGGVVKLGRHLPHSWFKLCNCFHHSSTSHLGLGRGFDLVFSPRYFQATPATTHTVQNLSCLQPPETYCAAINGQQHQDLRSRTGVGSNPPRRYRHALTEDGS